MVIIDREVVWNEVFEVWNTLDLVFEDLRKLFSEGLTSLRYIYEISWILGENSQAKRLRYAMAKIFNLKARPYSSKDILTNYYPKVGKKFGESQNKFGFQLGG